MATPSDIGDLFQFPLVKYTAARAKAAERTKAALEKPFEEAAAAADDARKKARRALDALLVF